MEKYPTILELLDSGYGKTFVQALLDGIQCCGQGLAQTSVISERDSEMIYHMTWLVKVLLKDCCGVDVEE
nr:MAG TPA: hypothetical protein [Caudoviricetes sp.]